ncbi:hypothetical protein WEH80_39960 [Actinomycetes bacterium KLBMP 9759]
MPLSHPMPTGGTERAGDAFARYVVGWAARDAIAVLAPDGSAGLYRPGWLPVPDGVATTPPSIVLTSDGAVERLYSDVFSGTIELPATVTRAVARWVPDSRRGGAGAGPFAGAPIAGGDPIRNRGPPPADLLHAIPEYDRFPTVDELHREMAAIAERHPTITELRWIGHSRRGEAISLLTVRGGEAHALVLGGAHPNEPAGHLTTLALAGPSVQFCRTEGPASHIGSPTVSRRRGRASSSIRRRLSARKHGSRSICRWPGRCLRLLPPSGPPPAAGGRPETGSVS